MGKEYLLGNYTRWGKQRHFLQRNYNDRLAPHVDDIGPYQPAQDGVGKEDREQDGNDGDVTRHYVGILPHNFKEGKSACNKIEWWLLTRGTVNNHQNNHTEISAPLSNVSCALSPGNKSIPRLKVQSRLKPTR